MTVEPNEVLIEKVSGLSKVVVLFTNKVDDLAKQMKHSKTLVIGLAVSVFFDLVLSGGLFYALHGVDDSQTKANNTIVAVCEARNETIIKQRALWDGLLSLFERPGTTTNSNTVVAINKLLNDAFQKRDC